MSELHDANANPEVQSPHSAAGDTGSLRVDFVSGKFGYARRVNRFGLLYQAVGFRRGRPTVLDATAGLGGDAFRLAYHGCRVTAVERSKSVFLLFKDALVRAERVPEIREHLGDRLQLIHADSRDVLRRLSPTEFPDVVYLDPMYTPTKKSAHCKVEMRILRELVGDDTDASELFPLARSVARQRVVVKRHRFAEPLAANPTHSHCDNSTRYDVYVCAAQRGES